MAWSIECVRERISIRTRRSGRLPRSKELLVNRFDRNHTSTLPQSHTPSLPRSPRLQQDIFSSHVQLWQDYFIVNQLHRAFVILLRYFFHALVSFRVSTLFSAPVPFAPISFCTHARFRNILNSLTSTPLQCIHPSFASPTPFAPRSLLCPYTLLWP